MVSWEDISNTKKERVGGEILSLSLSLSFILLLCYTHFVTHTQLMIDVFSMVSWVEMGFRDKKTELLVVVGSFFFVPPPKMNLSMVAEIQECHPPCLG